MEKRFCPGCLNSRIKTIISTETIVEQYFIIAYFIW